jgi:hypothetical protein
MLRPFLRDVSAAFRGDVGAWLQPGAPAAVGEIIAQPFVAAADRGGRQRTLEAAWRNTAPKNILYQP